MKPLISVIIPTFNRPQLLKKALNSVISQDYKNLEIIVSDDANDDSAREICASFADKRIKFIKNKTHAKSPNGNKNNGFDAVSGELVCVLDDDDEMLLNAISECVKIIDSGYDAVFADGLCKKNGVLTDQLAGRNPYEKSTQMSKIDYHCGRINGEYFKLFKREFIKEFRFDESSFGGENELYVRFFDKRVFYLKKPLYIYRIEGEDSATKNASKHAKGVAYAYIKSAKIYHDIASVYEPKFLALLYKNAGYYAKMGGDYKLALKCIVKSLKIKLNPQALILFLLLILPNGFLARLSKVRVWIKKRFKI